MTVRPGRWLAVLWIALAAAAHAHDGMHERIAALTAEFERAPSAALLVRRGECHLLHGEPALARADAERAMALDTLAPGARTLAAQSLLDLGRPAEAARAGDEAIRAGEDNPTSRLVRGRARRATGDTTGAAGDLGHAAAANPPDPEVLQEWIRALESCPGGGPEPALAAAASALLRTGPCLTLELEALRLERARRDWEPALARVADLARRYPRAGHWDELRGDVLAEAGRVVEAQGAYDQGRTAMLTLSAHVRLRPANRDLLARLERKAGKAVIPSAGPDAAAVQKTGP